MADILISHAGLTLKYHKESSSAKEKGAANIGDAEELVLTNMAFYTGLHLWEIIAPISCNSMRKWHLPIRCKWIVHPLLPPYLSFSFFLIIQI